MFKILLLTVLLFLVGCTNPKFQKGDCIKDIDFTLEEVKNWEDKIVQVDTENDFYIVRSCWNYSPNYSKNRCDHWSFRFKTQDIFEKTNCKGYERYL